jgi:hypothetical protein
MKRLSLLLALGIAGSAATAQAWPYYPRWEPANRPDRYGDDIPYHHQRYDERRWGRDFRGRWRVLAQDYSARADRQFINLRGAGGRFERLVVQAVRGNPVIHKIAIEYLDNPNTHVVNLETQLPEGESEVIRLDGSQRINRIIVYTEPRFGGSYTIFGT